MKSGLSLTVGLRQELKLQPRQILCNELLMLPLQDLEAALQTELEENIFLEAEDRHERTQLMPEPLPTVKMTPPGGDEDPQTAQDEQMPDASQLSNLLEFLKDSRTSTAPSGGDIPEAFDVESRLPLSMTWRQNLLEAIRLERMSEEEENVAGYLIECLDERGYLNESLEEVAAAVGTDTETVEVALEIVQKSAPPGVGAQNLQERLLLRCKALPARSEILEKLLTKGFKELLQGKFDVLKRKLNIAEDDLRDALELLRELAKDSIPIEDGEPAAGVIPDATVVKTDDGWKVLLHDESVPRLRLSPYASGLAKKADSLTPEAKDYLQRSLNRAKWMMEALDQRRKTLRRIVEAVVQRQEGYFEEGPEALVPLRQEDVADQLSLHASTVSRAVQEKYIETPHGVAPLKMFFPRGVNNVDGSQQARNTVQERLAALVEQEDPERPLSDDTLVAMLKKENISLSRRTVCKYRDELGISPASRRKGLHKVMKGSSKR